MSAFELNDTLTAILSGYSSEVQQGVTMNSQFALPSLTVTTDMARLTDILNHLLANAVKFTVQGSITIGYDAPADKRLRIWIQDTGKGIAPEHQKQVFERFFKVDEYIPGAGLGLSICRTLAYSIGGEVGVESTLGEGSKFWLELPI